MHDPLRIELDDPDLAESLRRELSLFHAEVEHRDGLVHVRLDLVSGNPESRIAAALDAVDTWLVRTGTPSVRVHVDGRVYTLSAPQA